MIKKLFLILFISSFISFSAFSESFDDFKKNINSDFSDKKDEFAKYKLELEKEFAEYKKIMEKEYSDYKKEILSKWNTPEMGTATKLVEYTKDLTNKKVVDFENGTFRLEVIGNNSDKALKELDELMIDMLTLDKATAFQRDIPASRTDEQARKKLKNIATDTVKKENVIGNALIGKSNPDVKDIEKAADKLKENIKITEEPAKTGGTVYVLEGKLPPEIYRKKADELLPSVKKYSKEFNIQPSLIYSVIQTESAFNPLAKSHIPAYGLMQIVPVSAGKDVAQMLMGKQLILTPSYLFNSDNNVRAGTAYLHILYYRYLKNINHPESRFYCSIASYNTGAGNLASSFNGGSSAGKNRYNINIASGIINGMKPADVYNHLRFKLEYDEARKYVDKVNKALPSYKYYD